MSVRMAAMEENGEEEGGKMPKQTKEGKKRVCESWESVKSE